MFESLTKREHGDQLEAFASKQLQRQGYQIIERNYLCKLGEIDIIAKHEHSLIFVEVRYRKNDSFGGAVASVDLRKQKKIVRAASLYLQQNKITNKQPCRFDVFAIEGHSGSLSYNWIKDAFTS